MNVKTIIKMDLENNLKLAMAHSLETDDVENRSWNLNTLRVSLFDIVIQIIDNII